MQNICDHCGKENKSTIGIKCSNCGKLTQSALMALPVLGVFIFLFAISAPYIPDVLWGEDPKPTPAAPVQAAPARDPEYSRRIEVQSCTQLYVEGMLKSPNTADHPWVLASDIVTKVSEGKYRARSYVDAENAYGAVIRAYYSCDVVLSDDRCSDVTCDFD